MQYDVCHTLKFSVSVQVNKYYTSKYKVTASETKVNWNNEIQLLLTLTCGVRLDEIKVKHCQNWNGMQLQNGTKYLSSTS